MHKSRNSQQRFWAENREVLRKIETPALPHLLERPEA